VSPAAHLQCMFGLEEGHMDDCCHPGIATEQSSIWLSVQWYNMLTETYAGSRISTRTASPSSASTGSA
jgi:hypothetical protein